MDVTEVSTIRLGRGVSIYPKMNTSSRSCVVFWNAEDPDDIHVNDVDDSKVNMKELTPNWKGTFSVQMCLQEEGSMSLGDSIAEAAVPEAETTEPNEISDRLPTTQEEADKDITTDNEDDDQQAFLNFAGEFFFWC